MLCVVQGMIRDTEREKYSLRAVIKVAWRLMRLGINLFRPKFSSGRRALILICQQRDWRAMQQRIQRD